MYGICNCKIRDWCMVFATVKFEIDVWYIVYYQNCKLIPLLFIILKKCVPKNKSLVS
jgi:hypothetical protein